MNNNVTFKEWYLTLTDVFGNTTIYLDENNEFQIKPEEAINEL